MESETQPEEKVLVSFSLGFVGIEDRSGDLMCDVIDAEDEITPGFSRKTGSVREREERYSPMS
jgi:hypothetical protein